MELEPIHELNDAQILQLVDLYKTTWWAEDRTLENVREMLAHTDFVFGFVRPENETLVAFARVLSDWTYFAFIFDVIVAPEYRRMGIGSRVVDSVKKHPIIAKVQNIELCCLEEMKAFYKRHGFSEGSGRMQIKHKGPAAGM